MVNMQSYYRYQCDRLQTRTLRVASQCMMQTRFKCKNRELYRRREEGVEKSRTISSDKAEITLRSNGYGASGYNLGPLISTNWMTDAMSPVIELMPASGDLSRRDQSPLSSTSVNHTAYTRTSCLSNVMKRSLEPSIQS